ncbi:MAG: DegT/DnrJ/EryC1/StrS family aminotransferase [Gemmatimonadaceae bacterium]|nr:DegT/DnrJ/EryC1/StrS family aminotransferase [Gemmatimonadaceae bacterium]
MSRLAINGGTPVRTTPFPRYNTIGEEEKRAVAAVLDSGELSGFLGTWSPAFHGGTNVQRLERDWEAFFGVKHAVSVNAATSGLYAAVGAAGVGPGDEVIVSPYTMTASASAAIVYGAIPVFADIDEDTFCITPETIRQRLSPYTKAIIVVDLLGHPADIDGIMEIARERNLVVIEDAAQAPGATYNGRHAGTLAHMGVFSLNYHKTIHTGEGGVVVTDDARLADRLALIRNHGEVVVKDMGVEDIVNLVGFNYRMTEIEAAIGIEQLRKLPALHPPRVACAEFLTERLRLFPGLRTPVVKEGVMHGYYRYALRFDEDVVGVSRDRFVDALNAEGIPMVKGYTEPIYLEPMYQKRIAFGKDGFPFTYPGWKGTVSYEPGICPVIERLYYKELMCTDVIHASMTEADLMDVVTAFEKVYENRYQLPATR